MLLKYSNVLDEDVAEADMEKAYDGTWVHVILIMFMQLCN